jgi:hypothetical protein
VSGGFGLVLPRRTGPRSRLELAHPAGPLSEKELLAQCVHVAAVGRGEHRRPTQFALVVVSKPLVGALTCDGELRKERLIRMSERSMARAASRVGVADLLSTRRHTVPAWRAGSIIGGCGA